MNDYLMAALLAVALFGAYHQFMQAWFFYQAKKRRREEVRARLFRLVVSDKSKDAA